MENESGQLIKKLLTISPSTGEVIREETYYKDINENYIWIRYSEHKGFISGIREINVFRMCYLATFMDYSGILRVENGAPMTREDIMRCLHISLAEFINFYGNAIRHKLIMRKRDGIYINSEYFFRDFERVTAATHNKDGLTRLYIDVTRDIYANTTVREKSDIGYLLRLVPYIHPEWNIPVSNVSLKKHNDLKILSAKDICKIMRYDISFLDELLEILKHILFRRGVITEHLIVYQEFFYNHTTHIKIIINPAFIFAGDDPAYISRIANFSVGAKEMML